jgi:hypothetical protein
MIETMISSTVEDLRAERIALEKAIDAHPLFTAIGADPVKRAVALSSSINTRDMADACQVYILILGERFGFELDTEESATEAEFRTAYRNDPTKIIVFLKGSKVIEDKQNEFISKVSGYYSGYWRVEYTDPEELTSLAIDALNHWVLQRASLNTKLTYFDHFARLAVQRRPASDADVTYSITKTDVELNYSFFGRDFSIHFSKEEIHKDFWLCLHKLEKAFKGWRGE